MLPKQPKLRQAQGLPQLQLNLLFANSMASFIGAVSPGTALGGSCPHTTHVYHGAGKPTCTYMPAIRKRTCRGNHAGCCQGSCQTRNDVMRTWTHGHVHCFVVRSKYGTKHKDLCQATLAISATTAPRLEMGCHLLWHLFCTPKQEMCAGSFPQAQRLRYWAFDFPASHSALSPPMACAPWFPFTFCGEDAAGPIEGVPSICSHLQSNGPTHRLKAHGTAPGSSVSIGLLEV